MTTQGAPQFSIHSLKAETALSDLIHRAGHDIGNPLTSLISLASLLQRSQSDPLLQLKSEEIERYSATIIADAWRVQGISEKLVLIFSDRGHGSLSTDTTSVLQASIRKVLRKPAFHECDIIFSPPTETVMAKIDPAQLEWLVGELLQNALSAACLGEQTAEGVSTTDREQDVRLSLTKSGEGALIVVENRMAQPIEVPLETLFEPFVKYPVSARGAGLGLTAAWSVVSRVNGTILLDASDGRFRAIVEIPA